jgi:hypothetical protein
MVLKETRVGRGWRGRTVSKDIRVTKAPKVNRVSKAIKVNREIKVT